MRVLSATVPLLLVGCGGLFCPPAKKCIGLPSLEAHVLDVSSGAELPDASVTADGPGFANVTLGPCGLGGSDGGAGCFSAFAGEGTYRVTASATGHDPSTQEVELGSDRCGVIDRKVITFRLKETGTAATEATEIVTGIAGCH